ncbi:glycerophosphodiester phosphodiesterase domain-containing protein 5-like [Leptodactylus fuscus]
MRPLSLVKLKNMRRYLLKRYEHRSFISLLIGLYSCRWKRYHYTEPGYCGYKWLESVFFILLLVTFFVALVFMYFWVQFKNDYHDFDWFSFNSQGNWFLWSLLILVVVILVVTYIVILVVLALCLLSEGQQLHLHWIHKGVILVALISFIAGLIALSSLWGNEWTTVRMSFQITAPYLHVGFLAVMTVLAWPVALYFARIKWKVYQVLIIGLYIALLLVLYFVPLGMYSPCITVNGTNLSKPSLIANRGSPKHGPENTYMSFVIAINNGAHGLQTTIRISNDGVPFLLNDNDLKRTTNVKDVFPERTDNDTESFSWAELATLNAGSWFMQKPPFSDMKSLSPEEQQMAENQTICKLADFLELASKENKMVIFDSDAPENAVLEVIKNSGIDKNRIFWLTNHMGGYSDYQKTYSGKASIEDLVRNNVVKVNLPYSEMSQRDISDYYAHNITTNLYVISEPWLFSLAWCSGAHSVTTDNIPLLMNMTAPMFLMTPTEYNLMWTLSDIVSLSLIILIFVLHCGGGY